MPAPWSSTPACGRDVLERHLAVAPPEVAVEVLGPEVVGDEQVGPAVAVVVGPGGGEVVAVVAGLEPRLARRRRRSGRGRRSGTGRRAGRCARRGTASACPPCPRRRRRNRSRRRGRGRGSRRGRSRPSPSTSASPASGRSKRNASGTSAKRPWPSFRKSSGLRCGREHQVLVAVVVDVGEQRLRRVVEDAEARPLGHVLERAVAARAEEPVGQARPAGRRRGRRGRRRRRRRPRRRGGRSSRASAPSRSSPPRRRGRC